MIPVGYMAKHVCRKPEYLEAPGIIDIYSVSNCISEDFADYVHYWKHNGYWFFDSPAIIQAIANKHLIDLSRTTLFYYEVYEQVYDDDQQQWRPFAPEKSFKTNVIPPQVMALAGYDVVAYFGSSSPACSPLSCNYLAQTIKTNEHCLLKSFDEARCLIEQKAFANSEPGPYRIFAVYPVDWM